MSESELTQLRKGKLRRLLLLVLIIICFGAIITVIIIFYMNIGDNPTGGGWACASIYFLRIYFTEHSLNTYYFELLKKIFNFSTVSYILISTVYLSLIITSNGSKI